MKKYLGLLCFLCLVLVGCSPTAQKIENKEYNAAVIQGKRLIAFQMTDQGTISGKEEIALINDAFDTLQMRDTVETKEAYYGTSSNGKAGDYLMKVSKKDWSVTIRDLNFQSIGMVAKGDQLYLLSEQGGVYRLNQKLEQVADNQLITGPASLSDLVMVGDQLYALGNRGSYDEENNYIGESVLYRLDEDMKIADTIVLSEQGAIMNMVAVDKKIYLTMTSQGDLPNGEPALADKLLTYDTETGEQAVHHLGIDGPREIGYNAKRNELYIRQEKLENNQVIYHLYSLDLEHKDVLIFPRYKDVDAEGFLLERGECYYYAYGDRLLIRDMVKNTLADIPLKDFNLDSQESLVLFTR